MVSIQKGKIQTTVYKKPTDQHTYLHRTSNHPKHTKKPVIYSQALRSHRICTEEHTRDRHLTNLKKAFTQQGHSSRERDRTFERATRIPREELLQYRRNPPTNRTPLVMTYHPSLEPVQKILKQLQPILERDPILKEIFPEPPILAFKLAPNLANLITRSKLPQAQTTPKGSRPCQDKKCKTCQHISTTPTITTPHNRAISIPGSYSCTSRNVIYLIQCTKCPDGKYVGSPDNNCAPERTHTGNPSKAGIPNHWWGHISNKKTTLSPILQSRSSKETYTTLPTDEPVNSTSSASWILNIMDYRNWIDDTL
ncbi:uncharacterized protein LOC106738317 [Alligator mississippiensis]|uniref:uncharacterized protein LOC106738317 n=1 Tax=Alligator mississippiensis TaxID=8496 RepID=UPI00287770F0|nr:uncharacterized protein LOC106738317 [Alligator mississippiensis]